MVDSGVRFMLNDDGVAILLLYGVFTAALLADPRRLSFCCKYRSLMLPPVVVPSDDECTLDPITDDERSDAELGVDGLLKYEEYVLCVCFIFFHNDFIVAGKFFQT